MGEWLKVHFRARVRGGGVLTFIGTLVDQAVYWFLEAIDPRPGLGPWPPVGSLRWQRRKTDKSHRATNIYLAPDHPPRIRYGMHYKFGEVKYAQESGLYDRVTVKAVLD
jgi:hypothetical protein